MSPLQHILRQAQRRMLINRALHRVGVGLAAGVAAAIVLLLFDRLTDIPVPQLGYWLLPAAGALGGAAHAMLRVPDRLTLAVRLDRTMRLKDRIGTATTLAVGRTSPSLDRDFAELVDRDAQRVAETVDVRAATPIHASGVWIVAAPLIAAFIAAYLWLPHFNLLERSARAQTTLEQQQFTTAQAQQMASTINEAVAELPRDDSLDEAARTELETLDRLARQLSDASLEPDELPAARDESAARLNELADRLAQQSQRELAAAQEIARRFEGMDKTGAPQPPMSAQEFSEALTRGDFGEAARELQELLDNQSLTEAQRAEVADHLRDLASHIDSELSKQTPEELQQKREQLEQALRDQGVDEQMIDQLMNDSPSSEDPEEQLKREHVDEEVARELARELQQHQQDRDVEQQTQRDAQQVQDALRKAAQELQQQRQQNREQSADTPSASETPPSAPESAGGDDSRDEDSEAQPQEQQQQSSQQQRESDPDSSKAPEPDPSAPDSAAREESGERPERSDAPEQHPQSGQQQQQEQQQEQQQQQQQSSQQQDRESGADSPSASDQKPSTSDSAAGEERPESKPAEAQQSQQSQQSQQQTQQQRKAQGQDQQQELSRSPSEMLGKLAERRSAAEDRQASSQRMTEAARELAQRMTPEERERWAQAWRREQGDANRPPQPLGGSPDQMSADAPPADSMARQSPPSFQSDDLDLRGHETADQIIAEWLNEDGSVAPSQPGGRPTAPGAVRQARDVAERAVNEAAVQKRYHRAIQRYFGRLNETASKAANESAPPKSE